MGKGFSKNYENTDKLQRKESSLYEDIDLSKMISKQICIMSASKHAYSSKGELIKEQDSGAILLDDKNKDKTINIKQNIEFKLSSDTVFLRSMFWEERLLDLDGKIRYTTTNYKKTRFENNEMKFSYLWFDFKNHIIHLDDTKISSDDDNINNRSTFTFNMFPIKLCRSFAELKQLPLDETPRMCILKYCIEDLKFRFAKDKSKIMILNKLCQSETLNNMIVLNPHMHNFKIVEFKKENGIIFFEHILDHLNFVIKNNFEFTRRFVYDDDN